MFLGHENWPHLIPRPIPNQNNWTDCLNSLYKNFMHKVSFIKTSSSNSSRKKINYHVMNDFRCCKSKAIPYEPNSSSLFVTTFCKSDGRINSFWSFGSVHCRFPSSHSLTFYPSQWRRKEWNRYKGERWYFHVVRAQYSSRAMTVAFSSIQTLSKSW